VQRRGFVQPEDMRSAVVRPGESGSNPNPWWGGERFGAALRISPTLSLSRNGTQRRDEADATTPPHHEGIVRLPREQQECLSAGGCVGTSVAAGAVRGGWFHVRIGVCALTCRDLRVPSRELCDAHRTCPSPGGHPTG
jgi:hypothetical protein